MRWPLPKSVAIFLALLTPAGQLPAGTPSLTRLVPADAGLCLSAEQLAPHADRFLAGPLAARWKEFPPLAAWSRENRPALQRIGDELGRQLGIKIDDAWRRAFGRQTVLAAWPPEKPDQKHGPGLLLVEADDEDVLSTLLAGIRAAQKRSGELLSSRFVAYRGVEYEEQLVRRSGESVHVCLARFGRIGVISNNADLIERVLDLHAAQGEESARLADLPAFQAAHSRLDPAAPLKLFINPRAWDAALVRGLPASGSGRGRQVLVEAWQCSPFAAFSLQLEPTATLEGFVAWEQAAEAKDLSELIASVSNSATLLEQIPSECLAAVAIKFDANRLLSWLSKSAAERDATRKRSAAEVVWSILDGTFQGLGPQFGAFLTAGQPEDELPLAAAASIEIHSRLTKEKEVAGPPLLDAVRSLLQAATALSPDQEMPPEVRSQRVGELEVLTVAGLPDAPRGVEPSFAFQPRRMFLGSSPQVVHRAASLGDRESLALQLSKVLPQRMSAPSQVVYLNLAGLHRLLAAEPDKITAVLSKGKPAAEPTTRRGLEHLSDILGLADSALFAAQVDLNGVRLLARLATDP